MSRVDNGRFGALTMIDIPRIRQLGGILFGNLEEFHSATWRVFIRQLDRRDRLRIIRLYNVRRHIHAVREIGRDAEVMQLLVIHH